MVLRLLWLVVAFLSAAPVLAADADLILHSGKVVTVDSTFSIAEAVAVKAGRIVAVGTTADVLARERGAKTQVIDLKGQTVVPGLVDTHTHPAGASISELTVPFAGTALFCRYSNLYSAASG